MAMVSINHRGSQSRKNSEYPISNNGMSKDEVSDRGK